MEISISIDDEAFELYKQSRQIDSDAIAYDEIAEMCTKSFEKSILNIAFCPNCFKAFKKIKKDQVYCSLTCYRESELKKQPDLPFGGKNNE